MYIYIHMKNKRTTTVTIRSIGFALEESLATQGSELSAARVSMAKPWPWTLGTFHSSLAYAAYSWGLGGLGSSKGYKRA